MAAVLEWYLDTGGSNESPGANAAISDLGPPMLRFKTADNSTIDTNNPIPRPTAAVGTTYSYWKCVYLKCTTAPTTAVDNFRFYSDGGGVATGVVIKMGSNFPERNSGSTSGYCVATGVAGEWGSMITVDYATEISAVIAVSSYDVTTVCIMSNAVNDFISEAAGQISAVDQTTNYLVLQMAVLTTASAGNIADETLSIIYDET